METTPGRLKFVLGAAKPWLRFRPHTGRLWLDLLYLLIVGALHFTVLPSLAGSYVGCVVFAPSHE